MRGSVRIEPPEAYWDIPASHCSQGDVYEDVPFGFAGLARVDDVTDGTRQRPAPTAALAVLIPHTGPGVVLNYTCGFMAQPPGTRGYGHNFRLLAPILTFEAMLREGTVAPREVQTIRDRGRASGYMYLPLPAAEAGSFEEAAALLYRPSLVHQAVLDVCPRVGRLSEAAQATLVSLMVQQVSPSLPDPAMWLQDHPLDRSDGWAP